MEEEEEELYWTSFSPEEESGSSFLAAVDFVRVALAGADLRRIMVFLIAADLVEGRGGLKALTVEDL